MTTTTCPTTVVHPGRPSSFAHVRMDSLPPVGTVVRVVHRTNIDTEVGNGQWKWTVVDSPWEARRHADASRFQPHMIRLAALDLTGAQVAFLDAKVEVV